MPSRMIARADPAYPAALATLKPPPEALWVRGELPGGPAVAIVGTRTPSPEGARFAFELASALARAGWVIWSGGALGIDQQAHEGALAAGGATVLVAGGGLDRPYPRSLAPLWERVQRQGALLSVIPDPHPPQHWTFFSRNAALAALSSAMILVEAPLKSGARNATTIARRLGRPVWIGAQAPWSPFAPTVREELRLGARLLLHPDDFPSPGPPQLALPGLASLTPLEQRILDAVRAGAAHLDALCDVIEDPPALILQHATNLLLEGHLLESQSGFKIPTP